MRWCRALCTASSAAEHLQQPISGNVTKLNFWTSLHSFKNQLINADFVAIDLEFSGIRSVPSFDHAVASLTSPLERSYHKLKHLAEKFAVLQVGVALFRRDDSLDKYISYPYNFYVFPRRELSLDLPAVTFSCEAAALEFLASHGFDFNLCIQEGISYLSKTQEGEARAQLLNEHVAFQQNICACSRTSISTSDFVFCERFRVELGKWYHNTGTMGDSFDDDLDLHMVMNTSSFTVLDRSKLAYSLFQDRDILNRYPSLTVELESHHQVCLAQGVVNAHFEGLFSVVMSNCASDGTHRITIIITKSHMELENLKKELGQSCKETEIRAAIGFRHIVDAIISSQKPVVGHNCALDFAHVHHKFITSLPSSVGEFSSSLLFHFPFIIDTKYLIKSEPSLRTTWARRHTSLNAVHSHFSKPKEIMYGAARYARSVSRLSQKACIEIMAGFKRYQGADNTLLHEAGYDAFMTGSVFAQICHQLHVDVKHLQSSDRCTIKEYSNLLNLGNGILDLRTGRQKAKGEDFSCYNDPLLTANSL